MFRRISDAPAKQAVWLCVAGLVFGSFARPLFSEEPPELAKLKQAFVEGRLAEELPDTRAVRQRIADLERLVDVHPGELWQANEQVEYYFDKSGEQMSGEFGKAEVSQSLEREYEEAREVLDRAAGMNFPTLAEEFLFETGFADLLYHQGKWRAAALAYEPYVSEKDYFEDMSQDGAPSALFREAFFRWVEACDHVLEENAFNSEEQKSNFLKRRYEILSRGASWDPSLQVTRPEISVRPEPESPAGEASGPLESGTSETSS